MTYKMNRQEYRIMLDTSTNQFMAVDARNEQRVAFGNTIEQAVRTLNQTK